MTILAVDTRLVIKIVGVQATGGVPAPAGIAIVLGGYLRHGLSCRDVEELVAERGVIVDHVTIFRWVQTVTCPDTPAPRSTSGAALECGRADMARVYVGVATDSRAPAGRYPLGMALSPPRIELRPATEGDREQLRAIHHAAYRDLVERIFGRWQEARQDRYFDAAWQRSPHEGVYVDGNLAGFVSTQRSADVIEVDELVIAPSFQGRGVGSVLLQRFLDEASAKHVRLQLRTHHQNRAARLYERMGFAQVGETDTHRLYQWDPPMDSRAAPMLLVIVGPPAVGKMAVGSEIAQQTGMVLFHNHVSIDPVMAVYEDFNDPTGQRIVDEFRSTLFREVAAHDLPGLIFTFVWAFDRLGEEAWLNQAAEPFRKCGGRVLFVELEASLEVRLRRNASADRLAAKPSKRDLAASTRNLHDLDAKFQLNSAGAHDHRDDYLRIDNTYLQPAVVANQVVAHFGIPPRSGSPVFGRPPGTLHLVCGLPGSGKSSVAARIRAETGAVRLVSDEWMSRMGTDGYDERARSAVEAAQMELAHQLLALGIDVVLESGFWSRAERQQVRDRARELGIKTILYVLDVPAEQLKLRLRARNSQVPPPIFPVDPADIDKWAAQFEVPTPDEHPVIINHSDSSELQ